MTRITKLIALGAALACMACVTRSKHEATVKTWKGKLDAAQAENARLTKELGDTREESQRKLAALRKEKDQELADQKKRYETEIAGFTKNLNASQAEIAELRRQREKIERSLRQFRKLQEAFKKMIGAGEIRVYRRQGRIMVALPSSVLFPSGKAKLSPAGLRAVAKVSQVFAKLPDRRFLVAGHTDDLPIKTRQFRDNWALSTARAEMVTRYLIKNGVKPTALAAAGYAEFDPLKPNTSKANRALNRRIEIILVPNIDELPGLPDTPG